MSNMSPVPAKTSGSPHMLENCQQMQTVDLVQRIEHGAQGNADDVWDAVEAVETILQRTHRLVRVRYRPNGAVEHGTALRITEQIGDTYVEGTLLSDVLTAGLKQAAEHHAPSIGNLTHGNDFERRKEKLVAHLLLSMILDYGHHPDMAKNYEQYMPSYSDLHMPLNDQYFQTDRHMHVERSVSLNAYRLQHIITGRPGDDRTIWSSHLRRLVRDLHSDSDRNATRNLVAMYTTLWSQEMIKPYTTGVFDRIVAEHEDRPAGYVVHSEWMHFLMMSVLVDAVHTLERDQGQDTPYAWMSPLVKAALPTVDDFVEMVFAVPGMFVQDRSGW